MAFREVTMLEVKEVLRLWPLAALNRGGAGFWWRRRKIRCPPLAGGSVGVPIQFRCERYRPSSEKRSEGRAGSGGAGRTGGVGVSRNGCCGVAGRARVPKWPHSGLDAFLAHFTFGN